MTTQIFYFHPGYLPSRTNAAMAEAARSIEGVDVHDVYAAYPDRVIDIAAEADRLIGAQRIVFQFPVHWYSTPSLMKEWQDQVLTWMFYLEPDFGAKLAGTPLMVSATAGNVASAYGPGGVNLFPLEDLLKPLQSTASRCGLKWCDPFLVYRADRLSDEERTATGDRYRNRIETLAQRRKDWPPASLKA